MGDRRPALALARPVTLGHTFEAADLREVSVAVDGDVDAIPADQATSVIGQVAAASLPAGVLLPRGALGAAPFLASDRAVAALALQPGQVPPDINAGASVLLVLSADPNAAPDVAATTTQPQPASAWPGVVVGVAHQANDERLVVSVELAETDARRVAAAPIGRLSVVLVSGGDR
ncbi:SAF domain-containing protein [Actinophytocola sp.]|uniref:SAF domain-containing protein n=1 Tax=Actinophytocola sp. TaxID=1872138 RepID=UPI003D6A86A8